MVARLRPTKTKQYGAMLRMSPRTGNSPRCFARARHRNTARGSACRRGRAIGREASPGQNIGSSREHGQLSFTTLIFRFTSLRSRALRSRNCPSSLIKPNWSDTSPSGCVRVCRARPIHPSRRSPRTTLCRRRVRFAGFALSRLCRERCQQTRQGLAIGSVAELSCRSASGTSHNTHCPFGHSSHINSFRADNSPCRDPSARNLCQTMWRCVLSRCFTVTLTADPHLRARAGSQRASSQASFTPTPPLRLKCKQPGLLAPKPPPNPNARPLPSPRGLR